MTQLQFEQAKNKVINSFKIRKTIGLLQEKSVHSVLKYAIMNDETKHEIKIGDFVADIFDSDKNIIYEIQTKQFEKLRMKLNYYFEQGYNVTLVYPVIKTRTLLYIDPDTYELINKPKISPKKGYKEDIFFELYKIKDQLLHNNLKIKIVILNASEYKFFKEHQRTKNKKHLKIDVIPENIVEIIDICSPNDYFLLFPSYIPSEFSSKELQQQLNTKNKKIPFYMLNVLNFLGIINFSKTKGRLKYYTIS